MHDCPHCGQACDCDGEDTWNDAAQMGCDHRCEEEDDEDAFDDGIEEGYQAVRPDFKPCPFCGCEDVREYVDDGFYCEQCGYGYIWTGQETEQQQIEVRQRWNTRPIEDELRTENERLRALDARYDAEFNRIEAIAVKEADRAARYEVFPPDERSICPKCAAHPRLLSPLMWQPNLPAFYVCPFGYIGQIGVGPVIDQSA
ncbi:MAG: hypothetical protein MUC51_12295 [Anaerolineae bacterium]|nr:hypothetical protein [Anaerolineae bacterium]